MKFSQPLKSAIGSGKSSKRGVYKECPFNAARNKVVRLIEKAKKEAVINEIDKGKLNSRILCSDGSRNKIFMFLINPPSGNAKIQKLIAKHIFECFEKRKREDGKK